MTIRLEICSLHNKPFIECCSRPRLLGTPSAWDAGASANCTVCGRFHPSVKRRDPAAVGLVCCGESPTVPGFAQWRSQFEHDKP